jgi:hypothetical protein
MTQSHVSVERGHHQAAAVLDCANNRREHRTASASMLTSQLFDGSQAYPRNGLDVECSLLLSFMPLGPGLFLETSWTDLSPQIPLADGS